MMELTKHVYLSVLARASRTFRQRAQVSANAHDKAVNERRARQLETVLDRTRVHGESFNLVDSHVIDLLNKAGIVNI